MPAPIADSIINAIKEGLSLWKTFIETRQSAYERKMDKKKNLAINAAEMYIRITSKTEIGKINKSLKKYEKIFFKYNN